MCLREQKLIRVLVSVSLLLTIMCKHKPKCLFRGLQCSVTHDFQALYRHLLLPKAVLLFLHSVWAFPPYFTTSWPVGLWNIVSICHTSDPQSISSKTITKTFLSEAICVVVQQRTGQPKPSRFQGLSVLQKT